MTEHRQTDLFYLDGDPTPAGSITTTVSAGSYSTGIQFTLPDGHEVTGRLDLSTNGSVMSWTAFEFHGDGHIVTGQRTPTGVSLDGRAVAIDGKVIPSYACSGLVVEFAASSDDRLDFVWLEEMAGAPASPSTLTRAGTESMNSPVRGTVEDCLRVELTVDGRRTNTYWIKDGVIVVADWSGARSFAVP